jgi:hypothetical protein
MSIIRRYIVTCCCAVTVLTGCLVDTPHDTVVVNDSAGIRLATTPYREHTYRQIDAEPQFSIGGPNATGPALFSSIQGVRIDRAGNIWVVDGASREVRMFRPDGSHLKTIGRPGEGPGEFQQIRYLGELMSDDLALWDRGLGRYTVIAASGDSTRSLNLAAEVGLPIQAVGVFPDGSVLAKKQTVIERQPQPGTLIADTAVLLHVSADGKSIREVGDGPGPTWVWTGRSQVPLPFTINTPIATADSIFLVGDGNAFRVRVYGAGGLREIFGVNRPPIATSDEARRAYAAFVEAAVPEQLRQEYVATLSSDAVPRTLPGYQAVVSDSDGRIWAQLFSPNPLMADTWDVYSPDHEWLGIVKMPGFIVCDAAGDRLVGIWRDAEGVEYVKMFHLAAAELQ